MLQFQGGIYGPGLFLSITSWLVVPPRAALELCSLATEGTQECYWKEGPGPLVIERLDLFLGRRRFGRGGSQW